MLSTLITMIIYAAILVAVVWLVIVLLRSARVPIPPQVYNVVWAVVALLILLWFVQVFLLGAEVPRVGSL